MVNFVVYDYTRQHLAHFGDLSRITVFIITQEENFSDPEAVHVHHPAAVKSRIPFLGKRYRIHKEKARNNNNNRRGGGDRPRKTSSTAVEVVPSAPPPDGGEHYRRRPSVGAEDRAASLARGLTRLIVALPAANGESRANAGESQGAVGGRSQSADTERPDRHDRSVSPTVTKGRRQRHNNNRHKEDKNSSNSPLAQMKRLSKSATTLSKSFEKLNSHEADGERKRKRHRSKSRDNKTGGGEKSKRAETEQHSKEGSKEVTIAKLGPFKMSLELRGDPGARVKEVAAAAGLHQKTKATNDERLEKEKTEKEKHQQRRRKKSVGNGDRKDQPPLQKQLKETKEESAEAAKKETNSSSSGNEISAASTVVVGAASKTKKTSRAERIIVSKLAKSDRPRRESVQTQQQATVETVGLEDYRLTLNQRKQSGGNSSSSPLKYSRSISQPNPPSSSSEYVLSELIVMGSSELGRKPATTAAATLSKKKHATSLSQSDRVGAVNVKQLRRSSTACEPSSSASGAASFSACRDGSSLEEATSSVQVTFDNPAFDTSPDLLRRRSAGGQQDSSWQVLRHQLLDGGVGETAAGCSEPRRRPLMPSRQQSDYSLMEQPSSSSQSETEDSSEDNKRRSPPTQTQSLSEGSSEEVDRWGRGRRGGRTSSPHPPHFDSDSDDLRDLGKQDTFSF